MNARPERPTIRRIAIALFWCALALYGASLLSRACLFVHERYGIVIPIALIAVPAIAAFVTATSQPARAAAIALGLAVGTFAAGTIFWVRYAFYAAGVSSRVLLGLAIVTTAVLAVIAATAMKGRQAPRAAMIVTLLYVLAAITFGQGVPDNDVKRPNALEAAATVQTLTTALARHVEQRGTLPSRLDELGRPPELSGYALVYAPRASRSDSATLDRFALTATPIEFGITGCHAFRSDHTGRMTYTRRPREATGDDRAWR